jgi:hypothetical protein
MGPRTDQRHKAIAVAAVKQAIEEDLTGPIRVPTPPAPQQSLPSSQSWRSIPLTVGLLVTIVLAGLFALSQIRDLTSHQREEHKQLFEAHNHDDQAHPGIRKQLMEMESRMTKRVNAVGNDVKELREDVKRALSQRRRGRHR